MSWPLSQDYNEAIQIPKSCFGDPELRDGQVVVNALGLPMPRSGNFADVYEFEGTSGAKWAIKCFTREVPGLHERYVAISKHLSQAKLPFSVDFTYLPKGIRVEGHCYPILKMPWIEGFLLNDFVRNKLHRRDRLEALGHIWLRLSIRLREAGIAHGDLQHGNVILVPGRKTSSMAVKLIDYDGMFVPALAHNPSGEFGHPAFQHPQRLQKSIYDAEMDRLPVLAIACALRCLIVGGKPLWDRHDNGDNLLFREADLREPCQSALFKELWNLPDAAAHDLVGYLTRGLSGPIDQVPVLHELMTDDGPIPLSADQEKQVTELLGAGARVERSTRFTARSAVDLGAADTGWWRSADETAIVTGPGKARGPRFAFLIIGFVLVISMSLGFAFYTLWRSGSDTRPAPEKARQDFHKEGQE